MLIVCEPSQPGSPLHRSVGDVTSKIIVDIGVKRDLLRADLFPVVVIEGQRILQGIVVEVSSQAPVGSAGSK